MNAPTARLAASVTLALTLSACGEDAAPPAPPATVTVTSTPTAQEASTPQQQELSVQQIRKALPTLDEAPKGFPEDPGGFDATTPSERTTEPQSCLALYLDTPEMRSFGTDHRTRADGVRYTRAPVGPGQPSISFAIWSHDEPYPTRFFDEAGAALADCSSFSAASTPGGSQQTWTATTIPTPPIGDRSFGVRIGTQDVDVAIDYLWVRSGHNLINVRMLTGFRQDNEDHLEKYAKGILEDLD